MFVIRPIEKKDYSELLKIAEESGHGFTSLPVNGELLASKIQRAETAFSSEESEIPTEQSYLFVMEDLDTGAIMGTSGIEGAVGLDDAFYHYHLSKVVHNSRELNIYKSAEILTLCNDYTGATELCTLFLRENFRSGANGRALSKCRFLFIAEHRQRFANTVIAEMRGVSDEDGKSPFWQWLEDHFFSIDFPTADYLTGIGQKVFIAELMPKYPVYVNLLSKEAQKVIGRVHEKTKPALKLLTSEGFSWKRYVDIFDAGPTVEADVAQIRTVRESDHYTVEVTDEIDEQEYIILANRSVKNFRASAIKASLDKNSKTVKIPAKLAEGLMVTQGDTVRASKLI